MNVNQGPALPPTIEALLEQIGMSPVHELHSEMTLTGDLGLDSLHLVELAYLCDDLLIGRSAEDDFPFFETVGELSAFLAGITDPG